MNAPSCGESVILAL